MPERDIQVGATVEANLIADGKVVTLRNVHGPVRSVMAFSAAEARRVARDLNKIADSQDDRERTSKLATDMDLKWVRRDIVLPDDLDRFLAKWAKDHDVTVSVVITQMLEELRIAGNA